MKAIEKERGSSKVTSFILFVIFAAHEHPAKSSQQTKDTDPPSSDVGESNVRSLFEKKAAQLQYIQWGKSSDQPATNFESTSTNNVKTDLLSTEGAPLVSDEGISNPGNTLDQPFEMDDQLYSWVKNELFQLHQNSNLPTEQSSPANQTSQENQSQTTQPNQQQTPQQQTNTQPNTQHTNLLAATEATLLQQLKAFVADIK